MKFRGLAFRLSALFLTGILIIFTIAFLYTFNYTRTILLNEAERDAGLLTGITMSRLESELKPLEQVPNSLVSALNSSAPDPYQILLITQNVILESPVVFASCIAFEPRSYSKDEVYYAHYVYETKNGLGSKRLGGSYNYFEKDWYRLPKEREMPMWIGPYYDEGGGDTLMCTYSVPFYRVVNGMRIFAGVLTMDISLTALSEIVSSVKVSQAGYTIILSPDGRLITSPLPGYLNHSIKELAIDRNDRAMANIGKMLSGKNGFLKMNEMRTAEPSWMYYSTMPSTGWHIAVIFPEKELFADLYNFFTRLLGIFIVSVLALMITVIVISRNMARPLNRLAIATRRIGEGDFHVPLPRIRSKTEIGELAGSFARMQDELNDYILNLQEATIARERIEGEIKVAQSIQEGLLPKSFPKRPEIDLYAELTPARSIGGDLYDFFFLDNDRLFLAVGDVSGKGVPASLFMTITRTLFRTLSDRDVPLEDTMRLVNKELCRENPNAIFVTFVACIFRPSSGEMEMCNAGHNLPLLRTAAGTVKPIRLRTNIPLGISEDHEFTGDRMCIRPGDQVIFYTDGINEAENKQGELFGTERLSEAASVTGFPASAEIAARILLQVGTFTKGADQSDDITLMVLTYRERSTSRELHLKNKIEELGRLKESLEQISADWKVPGPVINVLNLVLEELFTNIVFYGFEDDREHIIRLLLQKTGDEIEITIEDDGKPFNILESAYKGFAVTLEERQIGGEGLHLVRELMENVRYERDGERNRVMMKKKING